MLTSSMRTEVMNHWLQGNVDKVLEYDKRHGSDYKMDSVYAICYLIKGDVFKAYNKFTSITNNYECDLETKNVSKDWIKRLKASGIDSLNLNPPNKFTGSQSIEKSNEEYPELERLNRIMSTRNEEEYYKFTSELDINRRSLNPIESALAQFLTAEICIYQRDYQNAVGVYISAIKCDNNKALYWGYCGQVMNSHLNMHPYLCLYFINNAILLDPKNPRWQYLKNVITMRLLMTESFSPSMNKAFINEITNTRTKALSFCRRDQQSLRKAIEGTSVLIEGLKQRLNF